MGAICSGGTAVAKQEVFDPKDYMLVADHDKEIAKSSEQKNLMRFKVEVLINMLAIEEKKMGSLTKRVEVLKWTMLSKGVTEDGLDNIFKSLPDAASPIDGQKTSPGKITTAVDLGGAIQRLAAEFVTNKKDIVQSFADDEGKVVTTLNRDEFMRQLYAATEHVSKADIQAISLRFFDGTTVSIVEFIEFFMTPNAVRQAKAAAAAVRMSLDLLQLEQNTENREDQFIDDDAETDNEDRLALTSSHNTRSLDLGTSSLSVMWPLVDLELEDLFFSAEDLGDQIVLLQTFKKMLTAVCGAKSKTLKAAQTSSQYSELKPLDASEIDILAERFEIGGRVHFGHFLQFFREMSHPTSNRPMSYKAVDGSVQTRSSRPKPSVGISPFRMSSEWAALKADAVKEKEMEMSRKEKEYELSRKEKEKERERESLLLEDKEKEMFRTEMNAIDNRLSLLNADNKSSKAANKGIGFADEGRGDKIDSRTSLGVGGTPRAKGVEENIQRNKAMFPENFAESKVTTLSPLKPARFDSKGSSMSSPISRSPDSKVAFDLGGNNSDFGDSSRNNGSGQKEVRSVLGQYEEVLADNELNLNRESDTKNKMKDGRNRTGSGSPSKHLADIGSELDVKNNRKNGIRNGLGELDTNQGSYESKEISNNDNSHKNLPENIPGNRRSWGQSLGIFSKKNPRNDNDDIDNNGDDTLKRPHRTMSPLPAKGRGVTRLLSWGKRSSNDGSSPVAL